MIRHTTMRRNSRNSMLVHLPQSSCFCEGFVSHCLTVPRRCEVSRAGKKRFLIVLACRRSMGCGADGEGQRGSSGICCVRGNGCSVIWLREHQDQQSLPTNICRSNRQITTKVSIPRRLFPEHSGELHTGSSEGRAG